jgi:predicted Holliday junction resolvase-like endonuclease
MNALAQTIDGLQEVLGICPCCGEIFRMVEAKFLFPQKRPRSCVYLELLALESRSNAEQDRIGEAELRFDERFEQQKERLREKARSLVKLRIKKIDPTFTGRNIDPQDVKAVFHPVEYIVFQGLCSSLGVKELKFISRSPKTKAEEALVQSVDQTVQRGNLEFETLHLQAFFSPRTGDSPVRQAPAKLRGNLTSPSTRARTARRRIAVVVEVHGDHLVFLQAADKLYRKKTGSTLRHRPPF